MCDRSRVTGGPPEAEGTILIYPLSLPTPEQNAWIAQATRIKHIMKTWSIT
jgi:hypothetical protein